LSLPDGPIRIIAAYVNDVKTPEHETVTLLNTADVAVDLEGGRIADKQKNKMRLSGSIAPGAAGRRRAGPSEQKTPRRTGALNAAKALVRPYDPFGLISA
jgi:hypothetical protein